MFLRIDSKMIRALCAVAALSLVGACGDESGDDSAGETGGETGGETDALQASVDNYAALVLANYSDAVTSAKALQSAIDALVAAPDDGTLEAARDAWLAARTPYGQTEVFRFYEGPIDNEDTGPEGLLNAWPMDESYVDYVEGNATSGLINDTGFEITAEALAGANEDGGENNVATGYHPIEFLLWGQDLSLDAAGQRPASDYLTDGTAANQDRRGTYLTVLASQLVDNLEAVEAEWKADGAYRTSFVADADDAMEKMLTGMIKLAGFELASERLQAALDTGDQEDEHSCFSDNTHNDMLLNTKGVQNVFLGSYGDVSGTGVYDVLKASDEALADTIKGEIDAAVAAAEELPNPFDQGIVDADGQAKIQALITSLKAVETSLEGVFTLLGYAVPPPE